MIPADLSKLEEIRALESGASELIENRTGEMILVNCAGFGFTKAALQTTEEYWDRLQNLHVKGTQAFAPKMIERGYGKIVNLSST
jgi:short-subunit dehydrogenase